MKVKVLLRKISIVIVACIILLFIKNEYTQYLLVDSNYGLPALSSRGGASNVFIGSSMFRQGVDIGTLTEAGKDSYILAYNGNQPYLEYTILERLLERDVSVNRIYVDMYAYSAAAEPGLQDEKVLLEIGIHDKMCIFDEISQNSTAMKKVKDFSAMFITANNEALLVWPVSNFFVNRQFELGGSRYKAKGVTEEYLEKLGIPEAQEIICPIQEIYIKKIIALSKENNIEICFVETPKYVSVMNDNTYLTIMSEFEDLVRDNGAKTIRYGRDYLYDIDDSNNYIDMIHLSGDGRANFTRKLIDAELVGD